MAGATITLNFDDKALKQTLKDLVSRNADMTPVMKTVGQIIRTSVVRNFEKGGRPTKWKKLSKVTEMRRGAAGPILKVQGPAGGLMGSIHPKADKHSVIVGTNKIYAAVHQFGAKKGAFGTKMVTRSLGGSAMSGGSIRSKPYRMMIPWGDIPARPFLMVQPEDIEEIKAEIVKYMTAGHK